MSTPNQDLVTTVTPDGKPHSYRRSHLAAPSDACDMSCCRVTFTDHLGVRHVWSWERVCWVADDGRTYGGVL